MTDNEPPVTVAPTAQPSKVTPLAEQLLELAKGGDDANVLLRAKEIVALLGAATNVTSGKDPSDDEFQKQKHRQQGARKYFMRGDRPAPEQKAELPPLPSYENILGGSAR
jgi:hypothetical protein